jgi:HupE / UreJ protein
VSRIIRFAAALVFALFVALPSRPAAHDIPNDVTIQSFLKPEGQRLRFLVRVPLNSMQDIDWPRRGIDILDVSRAGSSLRDAATLWLADNVTMYEGDTALPYPSVASVRGTAAGDRSFDTYEQALMHVTTPAPADSYDVTVSGGFLDVLFEYTIVSETSRFAIHPRLGRLGIRTVTVVRFLLPNGAVRAFEMEGNPGLVRLDPEWHQAAWRFVKLGFHHILDGVDHLLFLFCLVIPFRRFRQLLVVVTAFTVAHSVTLIASAYDMGPDALWFPPFIETLIAASIVYMALENIVGANLHRRWMITFAFGLVHGFGFSFALRQTLQFAGSHLLTSLLSFNIGVELGQLLVLVLMIPAIDLLFRIVVPERIGTIILSALVTHTGWHWMSDRFAELRQYQFRWPDFTPVFMVGVIRWAMILVALAAAVWLVNLLRSHGRSAAPVRPSPLAERQSHESSQSSMP